jgi:hypothetical protein
VHRQEQGPLHALRCADRLGHHPSEGQADSAPALGPIHDADDRSALYCLSAVSGSAPSSGSGRVIGRAGAFAFSISVVIYTATLTGVAGTGIFPICAGSEYVGGAWGPCYSRRYREVGQCPRCSS